jgi:arsenate reductase
MAEGFAKFYGKDRVEVFSAGSGPSGKVNQIAIVVMKERGIDISDQRSKGFKDLPYKSFDYVITMGCGEVCPFVPAKTRIKWEIEDPKGKSREEFKQTRDKIENKVNEFLKRLE